MDWTLELIVIPVTDMYRSMAFDADKLDVLRTSGGVIAEITTFGPAPFPLLGLPPTLCRAKPAARDT